MTATTIKELLKTYLDANWDPIVITKPDVYVDKIGPTGKTFPCIVIKEGGRTRETPCDIDSSTQEVHYPFEIEIHGLNRENCDKYYSEVRRIIVTLDIANTIFYISGKDPKDFDKSCLITVFGEEMAIESV